MIGVLSLAASGLGVNPLLILLAGGALPAFHATWRRRGGSSRAWLLHLAL